MLNKKILYPIIAFAILVFLVSAIFALKNKPATLPKETNTRKILDVKGVSFEIETSLANKATAVSEISDKIDIDRGTYYLYKDGEKNYLLFSMDMAVIAVEKGTTFGFDGEITEDDLSKSDVAGVWFEKNGTKFRYEKKGDRYICQVNGGLGITDDLYEDYVGELVVINDGETEYSIFTGIPGTEKWKDVDKQRKAGIEQIVNSLNFTDETNEIVEETYAVKVGENGEAVGEKETITPVQPEVVQNDETEEPEASETEDENSEEVTTETIEVVTTEQIEPEETIEPAETTNSEQETADADTAGKIKTITATNQKIVERDQSKAYTSDIYMMLHLKDNGIITEYLPDKKETVNPIISVKRIYTGAQAIDLIKQYCASTKDFVYFDAPVGCSWHVAEYALSYVGCSSEPYINIKIKGLDGEPLVYRGVPYSKKSYDINTGEGMKHCFYAVPNGCTEYALECGTGDIDNADSGSKAAYYKIRW